MLAALLLLAPLVRGGNRELAMSGLLALGLALLATVMGRLAQARQPGVLAAAPVPRWWWPAVVVVASSPAWLGALQLLPIMDAARWAVPSGSPCSATATARAPRASKFGVGAARGARRRG